MPPDGLVLRVRLGSRQPKPAFKGAPHSHAERRCLPLHRHLPSSRPLRAATCAASPRSWQTVTTARLENPSQTAYDTGLAPCDAPAVPERRLPRYLYANHFARFFAHAHLCFGAATDTPRGFHRARGIRTYDWPASVSPGPRQATSDLRPGVGGRGRVSRGAPRPYWCLTVGAWVADTYSLAGATAGAAQLHRAAIGSPGEC